MVAINSKEYDVFLLMILMYSDFENAICFGHTVLVNENKFERISRHSLDLVV